MPQPKTIEKTYFRGWILRASGEVEEKWLCPVDGWLYPSQINPAYKNSDQRGGYAIAFGDEYCLLLRDEVILADPINQFLLTIHPDLKTRDDIAIFRQVDDRFFDAEDFPVVHNKLFSLLELEVFLEMIGMFYTD